MDVKKVRKKRSRIWLMPSDEFSLLVKRSPTIAAIARELEYVHTGACYSQIKQRIKQEGVDSSHITLGLGSTKGKTINRVATPLDVICTEHSTYSRGNLKRRLLKDRVLKEECALCGQENKWNGIPLVLILDHENGVRNDHRLTNLRLLCPNCNSQQRTFSGKNKPRNIIRCISCGVRKKYKSASGLCVRCASKLVRKIERPPIDELLETVKNLGYWPVARKFGVRDNVIRKWIKFAGYEPPKFGHWMNVPGNKNKKELQDTLF